MNTAIGKDISFRKSNFLVIEPATYHFMIYDRNTALMLSLSKSFFRDFGSLQGNVSINKQTLGKVELLISRGKLILWFLSRFDESLLGEQYPAVHHAAETLVNDYSLSNRWTRSLELLFITGKLFLPANRIIEPKVGSDNVAVITEVDDDQITKSRKILGEKKLRIEIELSEKVSRRQLVDMIYEIDHLDDLLAQLPDPTKSRIKIDSNSAYWGFRAWEILTFENPKLTDIELYKELDKREPDRIVPDWASLRTYYRRFKDLLDSFERR